MLELLPWMFVIGLNLEAFFGVSVDGCGLIRFRCSWQWFGLVSLTRFFADITVITDSVQHAFELHTARPVISDLLSAARHYKPFTVMAKK